jgi:hypothetical protein
MENSAEALSSLQLAPYSSTNMHVSTCIWWAEEDSPNLSLTEFNNSVGDTPSKTVTSLLLADSNVSRRV